jgi:hypothetical protein
MTPQRNGDDDGDALDEPEPQHEQVPDNQEGQGEETP